MTTAAQSNAELASAIATGAFYSLDAPVKGWVRCGECSDSFLAPCRRRDRGDGADRV
jgi:hypothetical protein